MRNVATMAAVMLVSVALAGCASNTTNTGQPSTLGTATSIRITSSPDSVPPDSNALVCWHVDGSGNVKHTALHWDNQSHSGSSATYTDYHGGTVYPNNQSAQDPKGYDLPGDFCANIPVQNSTVYYRAHVIDSAGGKGKLSDEQETQVQGASAVLVATVATDNPTSAAPNSTVQLCWQLTGTGMAGHTAIHWDTQSHAGNAQFTDYQGGTIYPNGTTPPSGAQYGAGTYCGPLKVPSNSTSGYVYYRAHVMNPPDPPGQMSQEARLQIVMGGNMSSSVVVLSIDFEGSVYSFMVPYGQSRMLCWDLGSATSGTIPHTAIHAGTQSHATAGIVNPGTKYTDYGVAAYYPNNMSAAMSYNLTAPSTAFCTSVQAPPTAGTIYYYVAHAIDSAGGNGRLSTHEVSITAS